MGRQAISLPDEVIDAEWGKRFASDVPHETPRGTKKRRRRKRFRKDEEKQCSRCTSKRDRLGQSLCRSCHNEDMRVWRSNHVYVPKETLEGVRHEAHAR